jgi:hypothetical protein
MIPSSAALMTFNETAGRDEFCKRLASTETYTEQTTRSLEEILLRYDVLISKEHTPPHGAHAASSKWPTPGRNRMDACIWVRQHKGGLRRGTVLLMRNRTELENELRKGGLMCALVLEFKMGRCEAWDKDHNQAVNYANNVSKVLNRDFHGVTPPVNPAVPAVMLCYLGNFDATSFPQRSVSRRFGVRRRQQAEVQQAASILSND